MTQQRILHIIGIGNLTRLDDGVAIKIIDDLIKESFPETIKITDLGTGGLDIALMLDGWKYGIIVDAVQMDGFKSGEIIEFTIDENNLPDIQGLSSTHGFDAITSLKLAYTLGDFNLPSEIRLIGIQIENMNGFGTELSASANNAVLKVIIRIKELISDYLSK